MVEPEELADYILSIPHIEGLSVTGGEPFMQPKAVGHLCETVRRGGLSIMVFTSWLYSEICKCKEESVMNLLRQIDILKDGPFVQRLADKNLLWRGSSNQQIHFLTDRYSPDVLETSEQLQVEGQLTSGETLHITGFPKKSDMATLAKRLAAETGILLKKL
jgi:anaerobic ribonucleoside-triphosphate reductase activating protein